jgi:hypothetical protein
MPTSLAFFLCSVIVSSAGPISIQASPCGPPPKPHWIAYTEFIRRHKRTRALDQLAECLRLQATEERTLPWRRKEAVEALRSLALRYDRKDLLSEFDLDPQ